MASSSYIYTESNVYVMKLSEYNELARALGYQQETIEKEDEMLLIPGMVSQKQEFKMVIIRRILKSFKAIGQRHFM